MSSSDVDGLPLSSSRPAAKTCSSGADLDWVTLLTSFLPWTVRLNRKSPSKRGVKQGDPSSGPPWSPSVTEFSAPSTLFRSSKASASLLTS